METTIKPNSPEQKYGLYIQGVNSKRVTIVTLGNSQTIRLHFPSGVAYKKSHRKK